MALFTIRVELHDASWPHYQALYDHMATYGFTDTMISDSGNRVKMPSGEYNYEGNATPENVIAWAKQAAGRTARPFSVLVTEGNRRI